jgi:copper chaperone CopZ
MQYKKIVVAVFCISAVAAAAAYAVLTTRTSTDVSLALAELQVNNMTCGSCVKTITNALEVFSGVESVDVSVTTGTSKVLYDPALINADKIADTVTAAGYPAKVRALLTKEQYQALQTEESRLAADYVARVSGQLISRPQFEAEVGKYLEDVNGVASRAVSKAWQVIVQKTLLLQAAEQNQVVVHDGEVDLRIQSLQKSMPNMDEYIRSRYGSKERLHQQIKEEMVISRNIEQYVLGQEKDPRVRQTNLSRWYQGLVDNASIKIYDPQLKQATSSSGGCGSGSGGGCCG